MKPDLKSVAMRGFRQVLQRFLTEISDCVSGSPRNCRKMLTPASGKEPSDSSKYGTETKCLF